MSDKQKQLYTGHLLDAVWLHGQDVTDSNVISELACRAGLDGAECVYLAATDPECKQRLHQQTQDAVAAGVFGVPSFSVEGELFWGSEAETMSHVEAAVKGESVLDEDMLSQWKQIESGATRKR
jgi:2-hydroxychromene-2-carboxylate isomerase